MSDLETTVTSKGQVTIPQQIRQKLGLKPHDKVRFDVSGNVVTLHPAPSKLLAGFGAVSPTSQPENFQAVREAFEKGVAAEATAED